MRQQPSIAIIPNEEVYIAGERYELASYRTDNLGFLVLRYPPNNQLQR